MRDGETARERKTKKRKLSTGSEPSTSSDENRKRRERKRERKEKRHKRSEKRRKEKRKKRRRGDDSTSDDQIGGKDKRSKHKDKRRKSEDHHYHKGSKGGVDVLEELSQDDYFFKNREFSTWLKEERGTFFSNLSSDKARELFLEFVKSWNRGQLRSEYYEGINSAPRTDHNWGIKIEKKTMSEDPTEERDLAKRIEKSERRKFKKMQEELLDELLPKATGREKILEKRAIHREQAKGREDSPELASEKDLMGGGDDFHTRLERERMRKEKKVMEKSALLEEKLLVSRQKEAAAMSQLQAIINDAVLYFGDCYKRETICGPGLLSIVPLFIQQGSYEHCIHIEGFHDFIYLLPVIASNLSTLADEEKPARLHPTKGV